MNRLIIFICFIYYINCQSLPENPCPDIFKYVKYNDFYYGEISLPYNGESTLEISVNASLATYSKDANIKIRQITSEDQLSKSRTVKYGIDFPYKNIYPKITQILLNNRVFCSGPPEPLTSRGVTSMWAKFTSYRSSTFSFLPKIPNNPFLNNSFLENLIKQQTTIPVIQNFLIQLTTPVPIRNTPAPTTTTTQIPTIAQKIPLNLECGRENHNFVPLIISPVEVPENQYPWLVAMMQYFNGTYSYKCTANLVSENHIITAARCVQWYSVQVVATEDILFILGKSNISRWNQGVTRGAKLVQVHPDYQESPKGDLAVITMDQPVTFSHTIKPICLWSGDPDLGLIRNKMGVVAGWGRQNEKSAALHSPTLHSVFMPVVTQEECLRSNDVFYDLTSSQTFCAGDRKGEGPCIGDSGAGFMLKQGEKFSLRGLVSFAVSKEGTCDLTKFIVFCDLGKYVSWIKSSMKK